MYKAEVIMNYSRRLVLDLTQGQSAFLWGARKTGKSTYLKTRFPKSKYYDLLKTDLFLALSKSPSLLREEILALPTSVLTYPIVIDEIQKIPALLDEVHWLIENTEAYFILCGSSARNSNRRFGTKLRKVCTIHGCMCIEPWRVIELYECSSRLRR